MVRTRRDRRPLGVEPDLIRVLRAKYGYKLVPGGKHQKLVKPGMPTIPVPSNREALSYTVLKSIANACSGSGRSAICG